MDILKLLNIQFIAESCRFFRLDFITPITSGEKYKLLQDSKYFPSTLSPNVINVNSSLNFRGQVSKTHTRQEIKVLFFVFLNSGRKDKILSTDW
jgi:hypothetical protein